MWNSNFGRLDRGVHLAGVTDLKDVNIGVIKSPQSGVTLCFQFVSAAASASASAAAAAAMTFASHVKTVSARP